MTNPVPVLSDDEVAEIEARADAATDGPWSAYHRVSPRGAHKQWHIGNEQGLCQITMGGYERDYEFMANAREDIPALCATVRALRQVNERLSTGLMNIHHVITNGPCERAVALGMATSAVSLLLNQNTALREQLAEAQREAEWQKSTIEQLTVGVTGCAKQLAQVTQERNSLRGQIVGLNTQLAQVTQERDRYADALEFGTRGIKCDD